VPATNDIINFASGTINLSAPIIIANQFNWSGGTLVGSAVTIATNAALNLSGGNTKALQNVLTNAGTITWTGNGDVAIYNNGSNLKGAVYNLAGALFDIQNDRSIACACYGLEYFNNDGLLRKSLGSGTTAINVLFTNTGVVSVLSDTLTFNSAGSFGGVIGADASGTTINIQNGGLLSGSFTAAAGAVISLNGGTFTVVPSTVSFGGAGICRLTGGTLLPALDALLPNLQLLGGTFSLSPAFQGGTITNLTLSGATLSGSHTVSGTLNWNGATITGALGIGSGATVNWSAGTATAPINVATNGVLNLIGSSTKALQNTLTNAGTITWTGNGDVAIYNNGSNLKGAVYNLAGALFDIQNDRSIACACYGLEYFNNDGLLRKSLGAGLTSVRVITTNSGTLDVESGTLDFTTTYRQAGATLDFGLRANNNSGHATFSGNVNLDGTLGLNLLNGYTPAAGDSDSLASYGSRTGGFVGFDFPSLAAGLAWRVALSSTALQVQVVTNGTFAAQIIGSVTDNLSLPVTNIAVFAYSTNSSGGFYLSTFTDSSGNYSLNVSNGTWLVSLKDLPTRGYNPVTNQVVVVNNANQVANFVLQPFSGQLYAITTSVNPPGSGSASGADTYPAGSSVLVSASPNTNSLPYFFANWTENGVLQSVNASYLFSAQRDRQLVANFTLPSYTISVSNNPLAAGSVSGAGTNFYGETNILTAQPNFGYKFVNWTEGGVILGASPTLSTVVYSNHFIVANYAEANLQHFVATATSPSGVASVSGAGTYTNGQTMTLLAPASVIASPFLYTFQSWSLSNNVVTTTTNYQKRFATTDQTNLLYLAVYNTLNIVPQVTNTAANYPSPVPATTTLILTFRFDRTMQTNVTPAIYLTNALASSQPVVPAGGHWSSIAQLNDTYTTPGITLVPANDGTNLVFISGAQDVNGYFLALTNSLSLFVDATPPALSAITANPGVSTAVVTWASDEPATSQVEYGPTTGYGQLTYLDTALVASHSFTLNSLQPQSTYHFRVHSRDRAGNETVSGDNSFVTLTAPDLQVANLSVTGTLASGSQVTISWTDTNSGAGPTYTYWYDRVQVTNASGQVLLDTVVAYDNTANGNLLTGGGKNRQVGFHVPDGTSGSGPLSFTVIVNNYGNQFEWNSGGTASLNNSASLTLNSTLSAYADLAVTNIFAPSSASAGQTIQVIWTDANLGNADITNQWSDQLFLSPTPSVGSGQFLATFIRTNIISVAQSVTFTQNVSLPPFAAGNQWLIVKGNAGANFFELNTANNSIVATQAVNIASTLSLTLSPSTISEAAGSNAVTATLSRNGDTSSPLTVQLTKSSTTNVYLPASVLIPPGQYSANFRISIQDNAIAGGSSVETISASASGFLSANAPLTILNNDVTVLTLVLSTNTIPETAAPGDVKAVLTRNANLGQILTVNLVSDLPTAVTVPASVTFPAGKDQISFPLTPINDNVVGDTRRAHITASAPGFNPVSASLDVLNVNTEQLTVQLASGSVSKGAPSPATVGTITRNPASSAAQDVALTVSNNSLVTVPAAITIPAGAASVSFNVNVGDDNLATGSKTATILAQLLTPSRIIVTNGQASANLTVLDTHGPSLSVSQTSGSIAKGSNTTVTVTRNTPPTNSLTVNITSVPAGVVTNPPTLIIPSSQASASLVVTGVLDNVQTGPRTVTLNADSPGYNTGIANLLVSDIYQPDLVPGSIAAPTNANTSQQITISWVVSNNGLGAAITNWLDYVYVASDKVGQNQTVVAILGRPSTLAVGASYTNHATFFLPPTPGNYWIEVTTDPAASVSEINKLNNTTFSALPITVQPAYRATISSATPAVATAGTPVTFTGATFHPSDSSPAPFSPATIRVLVNGMRRVFTTSSDANGNFSYLFQPFANEAGDYTVGADYPQVAQDQAQSSFVLLGMQATPGGLTAQILPNTPYTNQLVLSNLTDHPLTGLNVVVPDLHGNLNAAFTFTNQTLPSNGTVTVTYTLQSPLTRNAQVRFSAIVTSAEGAQLTIPSSVNVVPLVPQLTANPGFLA
jgi:hypothetical protein